MPPKTQAQKIDAFTNDTFGFKLTEAIPFEFLKALFVALGLALVLRFVFVQAFKIPTGSMKQTLLIGDFILVNKLKYGVKIPFTNSYLFQLADPDRGDIVVFSYPKDNRTDFIKRIVAVPGDTVAVKGRVLFINGERVDDTGYVQFTDTSVMSPHHSERDFFGPVTVPEDSYFVMGDNRDNSHDSRFWGFVPRENIKGEAAMIYFSWDPSIHRNWGFLHDVPLLSRLCIDGGIRWDRIGYIVR